MNKGRKKKMKKIIALIMCLVVVLSIAAVASAAKLPINRTLTSTSIYENATPGKYIDKSTSNKQWRAPFDGAQADKRVVARTYKKHADVTSATWVYTTKSYTYHPFKAGAVAQGHYEVFLGAKVDDRDIAPITISGRFEVV